jgi:hypothetical protein
MAKSRPTLYLPESKKNPKHARGRARQVAKAERCTWELQSNAEGLRDRVLTVESDKASVKETISCLRVVESC